MRCDPVTATRVIRPLLLALLLSFGGVALSQDAFETAPWAAGTGDAWIDTHLIDINRYAAKHPDAFVDEIVRYHQASRALVEDALDDDGLAPADVYYACLLAQATGRPCRAVLEARRGQPQERWDAVSAALDITRDAVAERRMRDDISASYRRWARPLESKAPAR